MHGWCFEIVPALPLPVFSPVPMPIATLTIRLEKPDLWYLYFWVDLLVFQGSLALRSLPPMATCQFPEQAEVCSRKAKICTLLLVSFTQDLQLYYLLAATHQPTLGCCISSQFFVFWRVVCQPSWSIHKVYQEVVPDVLQKTPGLLAPGCVALPACSPDGAHQRVHLRLASGCSDLLVLRGVTLCFPSLFVASCATLSNKNDFVLWISY